ncbi:MAG: amino acid permease [Phycisphaerales bacterium]
MTSAPQLQANSTNRFGTFGGVFTPCTLTILGVIMFLRLGQVVGNAGVLAAILIILISKAITTLTALSLSAIATNTRVQGGGAYYLISRSLGVEFGGAIGVVFFLAQAISVSMYVIGFTEALVDAFPGLDWSFRAIATAVNAVVFVCVIIGASWAIRIQYFILALLALSLISFFGGAADAVGAERFADNWSPDYSLDENFFTMFALFFPAATGIMAGANMSGDLRDPGRAIPRGTLASIIVTGIIYVLMALVLGAVASRERLIENTLIVKDAAWSPALISAGIFAATLSSALGSMMGAPRILQALARDEVFRRLRFFAKGSQRANEPRRAIVLTFVIAQAGILLGDLNAIAPIITMFFMITYGTLNLATFYESITRNPSYRPTFRLSHWSTALLGFVGCLAAMFLIQWQWALIAIAVMVGLHRLLERREIQATWGDVKRGAAFERARRNLMTLEDEAYHPKNWRPSILALGAGPGDRTHLAVYGYWLTGGRGLLTLGSVIVGEVGAQLERREQDEVTMRRFINDQELEAFPAVLVAPKISMGIEALVQCYGIGALRPNVVMTGWPNDPARSEDFGVTLRKVAALKKSVLTVRPSPEMADPWIVPPGPIDVWWRGRANGQLMALLAHLLLQNDPWRGRRLRLLRVIRENEGRKEAEERLRELIVEARIDATPLVVVHDDVNAGIRETSADSAVVFLGIQPPEPAGERKFVNSMNERMGGLGTVIGVWSAGGMHLGA